MATNADKLPKNTSIIIPVSSVAIRLRRLTSVCGLRSERSHASAGARRLAAHALLTIVRR